MIKYALICSGGHEFDVWFSKSSDYDEQTQKGLVNCPVCDTPNVQKAIMAPNITTARKKADIAERQISRLSAMNKAAEKIRDSIASTCDDVGDKFADEARAIHYGEKPERGIYGQATSDEASELIEEGIKVAPLPEALAPKPKPKLN